MADAPTLSQLFSWVGARSLGIFILLCLGCGAFIYIESKARFASEMSHFYSGSITDVVPRRSLQREYDLFYFRLALQSFFHVVLYIY